MNQPIAMGSYTFTVVSATRGKQWESADGTYRQIEVQFRLDRDDSPPFTVEFSSSFVDRIEIVDGAGNRIGATITPVNPTYRAGRYRSTRYSALFRFSRSSPGIRDFTAVGTRPSDFELRMDNPAPVGDQPRRVAVQLQ